MTAWTGNFTVQYNAKHPGIYSVKIYVNDILWDQTLSLEIKEEAKKQEATIIVEEKLEEPVQVEKVVQVEEPVVEVKQEEPEKGEWSGCYLLLINS